MTVNLIQTFINNPNNTGVYELINERNVEDTG